MVSRPNNYKTVEGRQRAVDAESTSSGEILDSNDGQAWETLREAGYEKGDFVATGPTINNWEKQSSTTSTSYTDANTIFQEVTWETLFPTAATTAVYFRVGVSSAQADIRLRNKTDGETAFELLDIQAKPRQDEFGPVEYTPTTTDSRVDLRVQFRNESGDQTKLSRVALTFGVIL